MNEFAKFGGLQSAYDDLLRRTLASIPCDLARLIYLASTRDYNSGAYHHEGLSVRHRPGEARDALQSAHRDIFYNLAAMSLEEMVEELELYVRLSREQTTGLLRAWQELEPYRVAVPMEVDPTIVRLFLSNIRLALEVLKHRRLQHQGLPSSASPLPSLGR
jgi:hypothetical protein